MLLVMLLLIDIDVVVDDAHAVSNRSLDVYHSSFSEAHSASPQTAGGISCVQLFAYMVVDM